MSSITRFSGEHSFLSNFYPSEVELDGMRYPTVEHAYQAAKTIDHEEREIVRSSTTPGMAKKLGKHVTIRNDWDVIKIDIMKHLVMQKFMNHPRNAELLISTGDIDLIEGNWWGDTFWGTCNGRGENHLGKILMDVRQIIKERQHEHSIT